MIDLVKDTLDELQNDIAEKIEPEKTVTNEMEFDGTLSDAIRLSEDLGLSPDKVWFSTTECNTLGGFSQNLFCFHSKEKKSNNDIEKEIKKRFNANAFSRVYKKLINSGYRRISTSSREYKAFDDTTVYDMYIKKDWKRLEKYFNLTFAKV